MQSVGMWELMLLLYWGRSAFRQGGSAEQRTNDLGGDQEDSPDIVLREHTDDRFCGAEHASLKLAWWGPDWRRGLDVTEMVRRRVASGFTVDANVNLFGDPAPLHSNMTATNTCQTNVLFLSETECS